MKHALLVTAAALLAFGPVGALAPHLGTEAQRKSGEALYGKYCSQCHGDNGDGAGGCAAYPAPSPLSPWHCEQYFP